MKFINLSVFSALIVLTGSAFAQTAFEGFYGQVSTGYEKNTVESVNLTGTDNGQLPNVSTSSSPSASSAPLVLGLGYTFKLQEKFTLGLGVDYSAVTQTTQASGFSYPSISSNTYDYDFSISNRFNIFIAPGYAIDDKKLAYVKLGYSNQDVQYSQTNCCSSPSNKANVSGYVLGLGYKQIISDGLYGFVEANYYGYSKANMSSTYSDGPGGTVSANPNLNAYNVLVGLGYKF
jgi:hypothetical protein